jgi:hypothetical protein
MVGLVMYTGGLQHLRSYCIRYTTSFQKPGDVYLVKHESEWCAAVYTVGIAFSKIVRQARSRFELGPETLHKINRLRI